MTTTVKIHVNGKYRATVQASADHLWGWRGRDKSASRAFGALSRDFTEIAAALRSHAAIQKG
jgi:hypothetical protein